MFALVAEVCRELATRGVRHALIGAGALAAHGVSDRASVAAAVEAVLPRLPPGAQALWRRLAAVP